MYAWLALAFQVSKCLFSDGISQLMLHQTHISKLYLISKQFYDSRVSNVSYKSKIITLGVGSQILYHAASTYGTTIKGDCSLSSLVETCKIRRYLDICSYWWRLKSVKMTLRDSSWYLGPDLIYGGQHFKGNMPAAYHRRGPPCEKHMGERRLELARLSKLCRGGPHQAVSRSQAEAAVFGSQLRYGSEAEARCL